MLNNGNKQTCGSADDIISYIYDEIDTADRRKFETHIAVCGVCTDEFAAISNARFSVFEWQKEEFAHLPTPEIVIPFAPKLVKEAESIGFLSGLIELLSYAARPATVAAVLAVGVGLGFLAMTYIGTLNQEIANVADNAIPAVGTHDDPANIGKVEPTAADISVPKSDMTGASNNGSSDREIRPEKTAERLRRRANRQSTEQKFINDLAVKPKAIPLTRQAPVLSSFDDDDDKSLRLADLFDDGGAKR